MSRTILIPFLLVLLMGVPSAGLATNTPTIELEKTVHFLTPGGEDVVIEKGRYEVGQASEWLHLAPVGGEKTDAILVESQPIDHQETIEVPTTSTRSEHEDEYVIILLLPDGTGLEALGSFSGVRSKAVRRPHVRRRAQAAPASNLGIKSAKQARPKAEVAPDLSLKRSPLSLKRPKYHVAVQFVRTANDDGSSPSVLTRKNAEDAITRMNTVWARNGGDVKFHLHPASNFISRTNVGLVRSTLLNNDCVLQPGMNAATIKAKTKADLDGDGKGGTTKDGDKLCNYTSSKIARTAFSLERGGRIIVFSRGGNNYVKWNKYEGHWELKQSSGGRGLPSYVRMPYKFGGSTLLAHEIGHYMHLAHPSSGVNPPPKPSTTSSTTHPFAAVAKERVRLEKWAREVMEKWAKDHPGDDPRNVFDGDSHGKYPVRDTPPDPRGKLFAAVNGDKCDPAKPTVTIQATVNGQTKNYVLAPNRALVMSYFKGCRGFAFHLSKDQYEQVHKALLSGNRGELIDRKHSCYKQDAEGWTPGPQPSKKGQLMQHVRKLALCKILQKEPLPWEKFMGVDIYRNPRDLRQGFVVRDGVGVNQTRENALMNSILAEPMNEQH